MMVIRSSLLVLLGALLLGACSGKAKVREPAELKKIEAPAIKAKKVWSRSAGKGADDRFAGLRVVPAPDAARWTSLVVCQLFVGASDGNRYKS